MMDQEDPPKQKYSKEFEESKFKPGQSGNPAGRPKGSVRRIDVARKWLQTMVDVKNAEGQPIRVPMHDALFLAACRKVLETGDANSYEKIINEAFGKMTDRVESENTIQVLTTAPQVISPSQLPNFPSSEDQIED